MQVPYSLLSILTVSLKTRELEFYLNPIHFRELPNLSRVAHQWYESVACEIPAGFFRDLQGLMLTNVRGAHMVSLEGYASIRVALKFLRSPSRFPSVMPTQDALACLEVGGLPAILYIAILSLY